MRMEERECVAHFAGKPTRLSRALALLPHVPRIRIQRHMRRRAIIPSYPRRFPRSRRRDTEMRNAISPPRGTRRNKGE